MENFNNHVIKKIYNKQSPKLAWLTILCGLFRHNLFLLCFPISASVLLIFLTLLKENLWILFPLPLSARWDFLLSFFKCTLILFLFFATTDDCRSDNQALIFKVTIFSVMTFHLNVETLQCEFRSYEVGISFINVYPNECKKTSQLRIAWHVYWNSSDSR